jgi:ADP-ribosylglycohydrolase
MRYPPGVWNTPHIILDQNTRLAYAYDSLAGLSVGDSLGAQYFVPGNRVRDALAGAYPPPVWEWTDDTEMACSVVWMLATAGAVDQDTLAAAFAERCEPNRGYGGGAFTILRRIRQGLPWPAAAASVFNGEGSCGNGAAMRVAPLGAYFPDSPARAAREAVLSAEVTHAHPEGVAGAVAVAEAAYTLGNGEGVIAQDTVPFTIWVAARWLDDFPTAIRACIEAGGDVDTTGAIVGGIVAAHTGRAGIPADWLAAREPLPAWVEE